jgi:hypothetical protein
MLMTIKLREYIVTLMLFSLSTSSKPEPEPEPEHVQQSARRIDVRRSMYCTIVLCTKVQRTKGP